MRSVLCFWVLLFICVKAMSQNRGNFDEIFDEAAAVLYSEPHQTIKITEHIVKNSDNPEELIAAYLLKSRAYYLSGKYNQAVTSGLEAKDLAETSDNADMQIEVALFGILLMNELGLDLAAEKYFALTEILVGDNSTNSVKNYLLYGKAQLMAIENMNQELYKDALSKLWVAQSTIKNMPSSMLVIDNEKIITEIYSKAVDLDTAQNYLEEKSKKFDGENSNAFLKMVTLNQLGEVYFLKNEYPKADLVFNGALAISEQLSNSHYRYRIVENMMINYMAMEDLEQFHAFKEIGNELESKVALDEENAVNSIFKYAHSNNALKQELVQNKYKRNSLILGVTLAVILLLWLALRLRYKSRIKQYQDFIKYFEIRQKTSQTDTSSDKKYLKKAVSKSLNIPKETEEILIQKLDRFENSVQYTKQDMSLALLAAHFETNTKYLSEIINSHKGKNFNSYINELRINYIIDKLRGNGRYLQYKISYLADESGFSSHSSFATVFKSVTGISPTVFIDILKSQKQIPKPAKSYEHAE